MGSVALVQLVPPGQGGVLDFAQCLQAEWAASGVASHIVAVSKAMATQRSLAEHIDECIGGHPGDRIDASATGRVGHCAVVLHFSGYGYGQRGLCFWLLEQLRALRAQRGQGLRLVVVFHELFASGPPWRSAFWLSRLQALIAARLARMADVLWTNTEHHAGWLRGVVNPAMTIEVQPVFSNVGEPAVGPTPGDRQRRAVVFGSASTRQRAFDNLQGRESILGKLGIEELVEVGNGGASTGTPTTMACHHVGRLEGPALSRLLLESRVGLLDYPPQFLAKSGVLAAYAAHGCVVLNTCPPGPDRDDLISGRDYLCLPAATDRAVTPATQAAMASSLTRWYAGHGLSRQAQQLLAHARSWP